MSTFMSRIKSFIPQVVRRRPLTCIVGFEIALTLLDPNCVSVFTPFIDGRNCPCICHSEGGHEGHQPAWMVSPLYALLSPIGLAVSVINEKRWRNHVPDNFPAHRCTPPPISFDDPEYAVMHMHWWHKSKILQSFKRYE